MTARDPRTDSSMLARAVRLARRARPSPNPRVGAVVARGGEIVGEGWHEAAGGDHAEVVALRAAGSRARGATLYVTLEPCAHRGRTPACTGAVVSSGVARVVVGCRDPNPLVDGRGVAALARAGIAVDVDASRAAAACARLVEEWRVFITTGLPFVRLKAAISLDGRMATRSGDSRWISSGRARREAHAMRDRSDAILVGLGTVRKDDPLLTVRHVRPKGPPPLRVVLDPALETDGKAAVVRTAGEAPTLFAHVSGSRARLDRAGGGKVLFERCRARKGLVDLEDLLRRLASRGVTSLLVEGGGRVHTSFLEAGLADAISLFVAPVLIGGEGAVGFFGGRGAARVKDAIAIEGQSVRRIGPDLLIQGSLK